MIKDLKQKQFVTDLFLFYSDLKFSVQVSWMELFEITFSLKIKDQRSNKKKLKQKLSTCLK